MEKISEFSEEINAFPQPPKEDNVRKTPIRSKRVRKPKKDDGHLCRPNKRKKNDIPPQQPKRTNSYQDYIDLKKTIEGRHKSLRCVIPEAPVGIKKYVTFNGTYLLDGNPTSKLFIPTYSLKGVTFLEMEQDAVCIPFPGRVEIMPPPSLPEPLKELFQQQEAERRKLIIQLNIERDKLIISNEQEIMRVHNRAARELAKQPLPFSACTVLLHAEVCRDPEEVQPKYRKACGRNRFNRRLVKTWLMDVNTKFSELKSCLLKRQKNEALALNSVQKLQWQLTAQDVDPAAYTAFQDPKIQEFLVPVVKVTDFELTPISRR